MMATANEKLSDLQLKNQHDVEEFKNYVSSTLLLFLRRLEKKISKEITLFYDEEALTVANKVALKRKIRSIEETELNKIKDSLFKETEKFLGVQSDTYKSQLEKVFEDYSDYISINSVDPAKLKKEFEKSKINLDGGKIYSVATFWKIFSEALTLRTAMNIESAYTANKPVKQFQDDVKTGYKIGENQLDATTKTLIQQAFGIAILNMNKANDRLISGYLWDSVLDGRTSPFCVEHAQEYWLYEFPEKSTLPYQIYAPAHYRCFSKDTEVYTDNGWKLFKDLTDNDKCFSFNPDNDKEIEFIKPKEYIAYHYDGDMVHLHNKWYDSMVTPNHDLVLYNNGRKGKKSRPEGYYFVRADELPHWTYKIPRGIKWDKQFKEETVKLGPHDVSPEYFCKFMGYYLSEGSCTLWGKSEKSKKWHIKISQSKHLDTFWNDLKDGPFKSIYKCKDSIMIHNEQELGLWLKGFGYSHEKYVPEIIKEMSSELITVFLDSYILGDGSTTENQGHYEGNFEVHKSINTSSNRMASDLGELIMKAGGRPKFYLNKCGGKEQEFRNGTYIINRDVWLVSWAKNQYTALDKLHRDSIEYHDMVYCVDLPKWHTLYVRRNGQPTWSGNCRTTNPPITKSYSELGIDPSELSSADKEYLSGKIPEKQTYYQWFSNQSPQTQKQILGATRYNAYANGSIKIDGFYNNGKKLTLTDLRKRGVEI